MGRPRKTNTAITDPTNGMGFEETFRALYELADPVERGALQKIYDLQRAGRHITQTQHALWNRYKVRLFDLRRDPDLEKQKLRERRADVGLVDEDFVISRRRKSCATSLERFIKCYLSTRFSLPGSKDQLECLQRLEEVASGKGGGARAAQAAPRGDGKTERTIAATIWAALYGYHRYIVVLCANLEKSKQLVTEIAKEFCDNEELESDWRYITRPISVAYQKPNRAKYLLDQGRPMRLEVTTTKIVFPTCGRAKDDIGGTVIEAVPITGVRGLRHPLPNGKVIRPTLALIDDPQTSESSNSPTQCDKIENIIQADVMKLAGPRQRLTAFMNCTVIAKHDVADRFLDHKRHPEWRGVRKKMVYVWPTNKDLWEEYARLRRAGLLDGDKGVAATKFYLAHRAAMDAGAKVGWEHRYSPDNGEHSAIQSAYNLLIDDGEVAFNAECQNEPVPMYSTVYDLTADLVASRLNGKPKAEVPGAVRCLTAFADINRYGLHWVVGGWAPDLTGAVVAYGVWPQDGQPVWNQKQPNGETEEQAVFRNLTELGQQLTRDGLFRQGERSCNLDLFIVDCGYLAETVFQYTSSARLPTMVVPSRGRGSRYFRYGKSVRSGDHWAVQDWGQGKGNVLVHDTDYHRMHAQSAFLLPTNSPGGITLAGERAVEHQAFATQICAERLVEYIRGDAADHYTWSRVVGTHNDWLDALVGARVGACYFLGASGLTRQATAGNVDAAPAPTVVQPALAPRVEDGLGVVATPVGGRRAETGWDAW